jgi:hypothetical protein
MPAADAPLVQVTTDDKLVGWWAGGLVGWWAGGRPSTLERLVLPASERTHSSKSTTFAAAVDEPLV